MLQQVGRECISFYLTTVRIFRVKACGQNSLFFWSVPKVMVCRGFQFYYATDHKKLHLLVSFLGETLLGNTQCPVYIRVFFLKSAFWRARLEIAIRKRCFLRSRGACVVLCFGRRSTSLVVPVRTPGYMTFFNFKHG